MLRNSAEPSTLSHSFVYSPFSFHTARAKLDDTFWSVCPCLCAFNLNVPPHARLCLYFSVCHRFSLLPYPTQCVCLVYPLEAYIYIYTYIMYIYVYMYIYIERERAREGGGAKTTCVHIGRGAFTIQLVSSTRRK